MIFSGRIWFSSSATLRAFRSAATISSRTPCASMIGSFALLGRRGGRGRKIGGRQSEAGRDPDAIVRIGLVEVHDLALDDLDRNALHRLGDIVHKAPLRLRTDEAEQIAGLTVIVISVAVIVAIGFTGDFKRWFVEPAVLRGAVHR